MQCPQCTIRTEKLRDIRTGGNHTIPNEDRKGTYHLDWEENNLHFDDLFSEYEFDENLVPASSLPEGWMWRDYDNGSGELQSPSGNTYFSYDLQTQEYKSPMSDNHWTGMIDFDEDPKSLNEFKTYAEKRLSELNAVHNLSPQLSEIEKQNLIDHKIKILADKVQAHYNQKQEPFWNFNKAKNLEILKSAIEISKMSKELQNTVFNYIETISPNPPQSWEYMDDSWDREQSYYEEAHNKYNTIELSEYEIKIETLTKQLYENNINIDKLPNIHEANSSEIRYLVDEIEKYFSNEISSIDINNIRDRENVEIISGKIKDIAAESIRNLDYLKQFDKTTQKTVNLFIEKSNINNQTPDIMEIQKEFNQLDYLKNQMKYLGFGEEEKLHKDLQKGINSKKQQFEIKTTSDKTLPGNKADFTLNYNKTEKGGVFLNSFDAKLTKENGEEIAHNFYVSRENTFTAKEAINLMEGRSVKIEFHNPKSKQQQTAFVQFNFEQPKTEKGNYMFQNFYENYGVDTDQIVEKSNLIFDKPEYRENTIKSLEKGNIVKVKFQRDDNTIEGKAILDPQNRNLKLYDNDMNRINTNKPLEGLEQDNKHEKNNVKEQNIKR